MNKNTSKRILAYTVAGILSFNLCSYAVTLYAPAKAAQSVSELENMKNENKKKIAELQAQIADAQKQYDKIEEDESAKEEYRDALNEKIYLQNQNIEYVSGQIEQIDAEIGENLKQINELEKKISQTQLETDTNMTLFKQRLRASYMAGNESISAVFAGSADFYDVLAKFELVSKMAEHDDKLIKELKELISQLKKSNEEMKKKQEELSESLQEAGERKAEFSEVLSELTVDYQNTQAELEKLGEAKNEIAEDIEAKNAAIAEKEQEHEKILADIAAVQERMRQESVSESKRVSESLAISAEESRRAEESIRAEESKRKEESERAEQAEKPVTQPPQQNQNPSTEAPEAEEPPVTAAPPVTEPPSSGTGFAWPVPGFFSVWSSYGYRTFDNSFHKGIDISGGGIAGAAIVAVADGVVASAVTGCTHNYSKNGSCGCGGGYGNYVTIVHSDGTYSTLYAHCQSVAVSAGQSVSKGQTIGYVGTTGYSTGNHLHFEVHKNGSTTDPMSYY
ncbi:MAG: murein hydrolase activator EnvC family protein [Oscillospiraceae bacterium]|nr:peptidoglycan DD-metalloendopeptidase family protein [Oscillospiraceae bacterium]